MKRSAAFICLIFLSAAAHAWWNPPGWEPSAEEEPHFAVSPGEVITDSLLNLYRSTQGSVGGSSCPSYPSCSAYSLRAIDLYGPLVGTVLTAARLVSEGEEGNFAPVIHKGRPLVYSPPEWDMAYLKGER
ncbi:MAG: hypothetical protein C0609_08705 [Deltaproteobacteria bacterium]|nr:MAG: hypothetical protein C0609_08705 [Deltaproteobacteria bacterium]